MKPTFKAQPMQVQVPATSANLGPGFDCLGLALNMHDRYMAQVMDEPGVDIDVTGEGADAVPTTDKNLVIKAHEYGYQVTLLFFWLKTPELAVRRVEIRVKEGGHNIPEPTIRRRYENGLKYFFQIFEPIVDEWIFIDNSGEPYELIAKKSNTHLLVKNKGIWDGLVKQYKSRKDGQ